MTLEEISEYLLGDLTNSVINDVSPCLSLHSKDGGYFAVPRLVLGYIDYLGNLYGTKHKSFLKKIFGIIDPNYKKYGDILWEIYRNGLTHSYQPKTLENEDQKISWLTYKEMGIRLNLRRPIHYKRTSEIIQDHYRLSVTHLLPQKMHDYIWIQPISIVCLYGDLLAAIEKYEYLIAQYPKLAENFRNAANELLRPIKTKERWWQ